MPGFSMMGSGIYSTTVTREFICAERCEECDYKCESVWDEDIETDDWGNIDVDVKCPVCQHGFYYVEEQ